MIENMFTQNEWWNGIFRYIISGISAILSVWKVYCALAQFSAPFMHGAHIQYETTFSYTTIMLFEWISATCFAFIGLAVHPTIIRGYLRQWLHIFSLGLCVPLFLYMCVRRSDLLMDNTLLFGGNIVVALVSYYVNSAAMATRRDIMNLKKYTYAYKKA